MSAAAELTLEAATADVIARYKRGTDMLISAAVAMQRLEERVTNGEAGEGITWLDYRHEHLDPHVSPQWINHLRKLAPPGAALPEIEANVAKARKTKAEAEGRRRKRVKEGNGKDTAARNHVVSSEQNQGVAVAAQLYEGADARVGCVAHDAPLPFPALVPRAASNPRPSSPPTTDSHTLVALKHAWAMATPQERKEFLMWINES